MKKILLILPSLKKGGGVERVATLLANKLEKYNYKISILTFYDFKRSYSFNKIRKETLNEKETTNTFVKLHKLFYRAYKIKKISDKNNVDIVISFMEDANFPSILARILFKMSSKLLISSHCNPYLNSKIYQILVTVLYNKSDKIITVSKGIANVFKRDFNLSAKKITTIYNPIDFEIINKKIDETLNSKHKKLFSKKYFKFISLGRLSYEKNHLSTIKAFSEIKQKFPHSRLFIIGNGPQRQKLKRRIFDLKLEKDVFLLGLQSNPFKFLKHSDCFIFNSVSEGFGLSIVEALASSLPVISSDCNFGPSEILCKSYSMQQTNIIRKCDFGILAPVNNAQMLSKAMEIVITNDKLRLKLKKSSLKQARNFHIKDIITKWVKIIETN